MMLNLFKRKAVLCLDTNDDVIRWMAYDAKTGRELLNSRQKGFESEKEAIADAGQYVRIVKLEHH